MENEVDKLDELDLDVFNEDTASYIKQQMSHDFPVERMRKVVGKYETLVTYYTDHRLNMYRVDTGILRNLRDHLANNGVLVERKARLAISRALFDCLRDPDAIPISEDRNTIFCEIRPRSIARRATDQRTNSQRPVNQEGDSGRPSSDRITDTNSDSIDNSTKVRPARLTDVAKCINRDMKYSGLPDEDFDEKVAHFKAALELSRVSEEQDKVTAIPCFLEGQAASTYRTQIKSTATSLDLCLSTLKSIFLSEEARRANDNIWDALSSIILRNSKVMLQKQMSALSYITRAKLLSAVSGVKCFQHVRANPPNEYLRLRGALYDAATQYDTGATKSSTAVQNSAMSPEVFYTDRKFRGRSSKKRTFNNKPTNKRYAGNSNTCWVCEKVGCHSTNHDRQERQTRREKLRNYLSEALNFRTDKEEETNRVEESESEVTDSDSSA
eukprot:IDg816t1